MKRLLIITGPTASGKTKLGVRLAQMFNGELISADSRQVYKLMDIGTGKDLPLPVPIWGLDLVKPDQEFSVADWFKVAQKKIFELWKKDKLPIIVGGTGFYLKALINGFDSLGVEPDYKLRRRLEKMSLGELQEKLSQVYSQRYEEMNQSDKNNPRRLIRAIEVVQTLKKKSGFKSIKADKLLLIGLKAQKKYLYQKIDQRVEKRIRAGSEKEVKG
ncbi:tRNA (adenosine(37)-N6)-dimethylallyltransferase MiaA, partial [Candidatus Beckwithbacteria bacterium CG10_big_fil_rev_8_21_14_0_10_34_10]